MTSCEREKPEAADPKGSLPTSRVLRFQPAASPTAAAGWVGVEPVAYKPPANHHCGVLRHTLVGERGERTAFHLRYFEIGPGGNTSLEHHEHEHVVIVLRGQGEVRLGQSWQSVGVGDLIYVAPHEVHQLRNPSMDEPFGFFCIVDAQRDVPVAAEEAAPSCDAFAAR
jgi:ribulose-bisphosphate carboxylase large chain